MAYINFKRPANADTRRRVDAREAAEKLESLRGPFLKWAMQQNIPREQVEHELERMDEIIENRRHASTQSLVD